MNQLEFNQQLCGFLSAATTPFHAVAEMVGRLTDSGYVRLTDDAEWDVRAGGKYFLTRNDSSIVAFVLGREPTASAGIRMIGAHTDSPCLVVKPTPEVQSQSLFQLGVEVYGGALLNPWFDRDLSLAGRVSFQCPDGQLRVALVDFRDAIATIPSLAIHLDRDANRKREVNPQTAIVPILARLKDGEQLDFRSLLGTQLVFEH
ncbi:MAG: M18 family aminopeptidase, partial [Halioglobus sp.]|nr:M18 family aminopeptidase [Halioglobus sp.]